jgi:hypothetical protein
MKKQIYEKGAAVLASIIACCSISPCFSYAESVDNTIISDSQLEYAENILNTYLNQYDVDNDSIYISDAFGVYNADENAVYNDVYIVFEDETIIGMLSVADVDGEYYSSFEYDSYELLQDFYDHDEPVSFVGSNETIYELYDNVYVGCNFTSINTGVELERSYKVDIPEVSSAKVTTFQRNLSVPVVANTSVNGSGICWAAAIASKYNYIHNKSKTALDVYNALDAVYSGTPSGNRTWTERGYDYYNIPCTYQAGMMNCVEVYNNIINDNPIHMSLSRNGGAHAVLLSGITINADGSGIYRLTDSNRDVPVNVAVSAATMTADDEFVYATSYGYTYTSWYRSFY